jgi:hypothetical protein
MRPFVAWSLIGAAALYLGGCSSRANGAACVESTEGSLTTRTLGDGDPYCRADADCTTVCTCADGATLGAEWQCSNSACDGAAMACMSFCSERDSMMKTIAGSFHSSGDSSSESAGSSDGASGSRDGGSSTTSTPCASATSSTAPGGEGAGRSDDSNASSSSSSSSSSGEQLPSSSDEDAATYCAGGGTNTCVCGHAKDWGDETATCSVASVGGGLCCAVPGWPQSEACACAELACDQLSSDTCTCGAKGGDVTKAVSSCAKPSGGICCVGEGAFGVQSCTCWQKMTQCPAGESEVSSCSVGSVKCDSGRSSVQTCR